MNQNFVNKAMNSNNGNFIYSNFSNEIKKDFENLKKKSYMEIIKFLIQNAIRVNEVLKNNNSELVSMIRYEVGEGLEHKEENFAEEVAKQIAGK